MLTEIAKDPEYEIIFKKRDPRYNDVVRANAIVREFIHEHKLVIYGGTAIDLNLRLRGSHLYSDEMLPISDYDFFSPTHAKHAYELADQLFAAGFGDARVILASHYSTMRVDIGDNHFIADISYQPPAAFDHIPTNQFQGIKIVSPLFQYMDVHLSLSLPYYDAPRENIFNRCKKDITRFNLTWRYFPATLPAQFDTPAKIAALPRHAIPIAAAQLKGVLGGFAAYSVMCWAFKTIVRRPPPQFDCSGCKVKNNVFLFEMIGAAPVLDLINMKLSKIRAAFDGAIIREFEPFSSFLPRRLEITASVTGSAEKDKENKNNIDKNHNKKTKEKVQELPVSIHVFSSENEPLIRVFSSENELIAINDVVALDTKLRVANVQTLLKWFLGMYFAFGDEIYLAHYVALIEMIHGIEVVVPNIKSDSDRELAKLFFVSITTYGANNISVSQRRMLDRVNATLYGDAVVRDTPGFYVPANNEAHPVFDYNISPYFRLNGSEIIAKLNEDPPLLGQALTTDQKDIKLQK